MQYDTHILIVGAGPAGLTLACLLAQFNVPFIIIDEKSEISESIKACMLSSRSLEIFSDLGLMDTALTLGQKVDAFEVYSQNVLAVSLYYDLIHTRFNFNLHLGQPNTEKILLKKLLSQNIDVLWNHALHDFFQDEDEVVANVFIAGHSKTIHAKFLIGADGASSRVRKILGLSFQGDTYPSQFLLSFAQLDWNLSHDKARLFFSDNGFLSVYPLPNNKMHIGGNIVVEDESHTPTLSDIQKLFYERCMFDGKINAVSELSYYRTHARAVKNRVINRVVLMGDAAHIVSPLTGLGMNAAIQDAENLAWKLSCIYHGEEKTYLLKTYQEERSLALRKLKSFSNILETVYTVKSAAAKNLRRFMLSHSLSYDDARKKEVARIMQKDLNYSGCSMFEGEGLVGFQAPDPWIKSREKFLFDLFEKGKYITLEFSGTAVKKIIVKYHQMIIDDSDLTLHNAFDVKLATTYVIRPDRYIVKKVIQKDITAT